MVGPTPRAAISIVEDNLETDRSPTKDDDPFTNSPSLDGLLPVQQSNNDHKQVQ